VTRDNRLLFRVVLGFCLAAWFCNAPGEIGFWHNFVEAQRYALEHPSFPALLRGPQLGFANYLAPALTVIALIHPTKVLARIAAVLLSSCAGLACLHLETCNDATFVTALWTGLWLVWLAWNGERDDADFLAIGRGLAHGVIGLVFLGGLVGKLTDEHRSGEAFFGLYFKDNPAWPYPALKAALGPEAFRELATWFARGSIWSETMLALAPFFPTRFVVALGAATMLTMMTAWTFHLFSVVGSLLGLLLAAEILRRRENDDDENETRGIPVGADG
jgi:hypothetical protein